MSVCISRLQRGTRGRYQPCSVEQHQHRKIACLEEIAYLNGWISGEQVMKVYEILKKNQYGQYLKDVLDGKYLDVLH